MAELDYTAAVDAAAKTWYETSTGVEWERTTPAIQQCFRGAVHAGVVAAAPCIARQAWELAADECGDSHQRREIIRANPWGDADA